MATRQLTGEEIEEIKLNAQDHFWPHARPVGDMSEDLGLKVVKSAKGIWVEEGSFREDGTYRFSSCFIQRPIQGSFDGPVEG